MNDNIKELLIDLVEYYNAMGTSKDPGIEIFENVVQRATVELKLHVKNNTKDNLKSADVDPYSFDVVGSLKHEDEF